MLDLDPRDYDSRDGAPFRWSIGCHEETVRRAYWCGLLRSQRFGVRGRRFHPEDILDWIGSRRTNTFHSTHKDAWRPS